MLFPADMDDEVKLWYGMMLTITTVNVRWYFRSMLKPYKTHTSTSPSPSPSPSSPSVASYQKWMKILAGIYVAVCAVRAVLPRIDVEKICLIDSWVSYPLVGRLLATCAELSFMAQLAYTLFFISQNLSHKMGEKKNYQKRVKVLKRIDLYAKACFAANVIAQSCCWVGITTTMQVWHVFEESIWAATVFGMTICYYYLYTTLTELEEKEKEEKEEKMIMGMDVENVKKYMKYFMLCGPVYVMYMCLVDVPMYYKRWTVDEANNHQYYTFSEGLSHAASCKIVSGKYSDWGEDFSWMLGYFSFAVWTSIWLVHGISP